MKVGIITFHCADNLGAMLQAYALARTVQSLGHRCEIIDYRGTAGLLFADRFCTDDLRRKGCVCQWLQSLIARLRWNPMQKQFSRKLSEFLKLELPTSPKIYRSVEELANPDYDVILFGSDQIWRTDFFGHLHPVYFGNFPLRPGTGKVAYAASSGTGFLEEEACALLRDYRALSVRELSLADYLRRLGFSVEQTLDPVFLLSKEEWRAFSVPLPENLPEEFILVYSFSDLEILPAVRELSREKKLPRVLVNGFSTDPDVIPASGCGPKELLALVDRAAYVCTDSFHGTALSLVFEKQFCVCPPSSGAERVCDLLGSAGFSHRILRNGVLPEGDCDYTQPRQRLEALRSHSLDFLRASLTGEERPAAPLP